MGTIIILAIAAFCTSTLSGMIGMGGGALLLAVLSSFLTYAETIPMHATVQIASNSTRVLAFWQHVDWPTIGRFLLGVAPGAVLSGTLLAIIGVGGSAEPYLKGLIGVYILTFIFLPKPKGRSEQTAHRREFTIIGFAAGTLGIFVGAVGPMIAPMFARHNFVKDRLIATKAVAQASLHLIKLPIFMVVGGFEIARFSLLLAVMLAVTIPGTLFGKFLLRYISDRGFVWMYRVALIVAGVKLLTWDCIYKGFVR